MDCNINVLTFHAPFFIPLHLFSLFLLPIYLLIGSPGREERDAEEEGKPVFPHNNRGIHGHPAPHQSTEKDGGIERLEER